MRNKHFGTVAGAITLASIITVLAGCGGSGGATSVKAGAGAFAKTFTGEIDDHSGGLQTVNFTVAPDGSVKGSSTGFTLDGTFNQDGHATLNVVGGTLVGTFSQPNGPTIYAKMTNMTTHKTVYAILLVSPSPANLDYMGYQRDTTKNTLEPIAFSIDPAGVVSGTVEVKVGDMVGFANVEGSLDSGGDVNLTEIQNGATVNKVTGGLIQQGLGLTGNIAFNNEDQGVISTHLITQ